MGQNVETALSLRQATATPASPPAGHTGFYAKSDGYLYYLSPTGVEVRIGTTVYVQPAAPTVPAGVPYTWWQTGLGTGHDFTLWIEDGLP